MIEKDNVERILLRLREVERLLSLPETSADQSAYRALVREHAGLRKLRDRAEVYYKTIDTIESDRQLLADASTDPELKELASLELAEAEQALPAATMIPASESIRTTTPDSTPGSITCRI